MGITEHKDGTQTSFSENNLSLSFPFEVVKGAAGYFSKAHSQQMEVPLQFFFLSYLTCLGNILSHKVKLRSVLKVQPRLYTVLVGESASDKKSTAIDKAVEHFEENVLVFHTALGLGSAEGLQRVFKRAFKNPENKDKPNASVLLAFDEFKAFVSKCKIRNSVLLECVNTLFEANRYENHTQEKSVMVDGQLSLLGASTIQTYERIYTAEFTDIGFPNRIFLVIGTATTSHSLPGEIPPQKIKVMSANLSAVVGFVKDGITYDIEPLAWEYYDNWYVNVHRKSVHSKRLDGYCLRLMMLLAINSLRPIIDLQTVKDAIALCNWQLEIRKIYDPIDADNNIAAMEERIRRVLKLRGPLKDYELKQYTQAHRMGLWLYDKAKKNLMIASEVGLSNKNNVYFIVEDG